MFEETDWQFAEGDRELSDVQQNSCKTKYMQPTTGCSWLILHSLTALLLIDLPTLSAISGPATTRAHSSCAKRL